MAMVQRPGDETPGAPTGDARRLVTGLSLRGAERAIETQITPQCPLESDGERVHGHWLELRRA